MQIKDLKEYQYKTELHAHTLPVSLCSRLYAEEMVAIYERLGAHAIVLTNHFTPAYIAERTKEQAVQEYLDCFRQLDQCAKEKGMHAILGVELRFKENINDYLVYGIEEKDLYTFYDCIEQGKGIKDFYREFKREGVMIFQAHPFRDNMTQIDPSDIDGVEAYNLNPRKISRVPYSIDYAKKNELKVCGGSDTHLAEDVGSCFIKTKKKLQTPSDVAEVLKSQDFVLDVFGATILL